MVVWTELPTHDDRARDERVSAAARWPQNPDTGQLVRIGRPMSLWQSRLRLLWQRRAHTRLRRAYPRAMSEGTVQAAVSSSDTDHLAEAEARAVVINVDTDVAAAVALASVNKRTRLPALLVNCEPTDQSRATFKKLQERWGFDIVEQPIRTHGATLDWVFRNPKADKLLLLDSDAELLGGGSAWVAQMRRYLDRRKVFGAGFIKSARVTPQIYAPERPLTPCMMLRTRDIQDCLAAGVSFEYRAVSNDFCFSPRISNLLAARLDDPWVFVPSDSWVTRLPEPVRKRLTKSTLPILNWARQTIDERRPSYVVYDTGAEVYRWCRSIPGKFFAGLPQGCLKGEFVHHGPGVSRNRLGRGGPGLIPLSEIELRLVERLAVQYGVSWDELGR